VENALPKMGTVKYPGDIARLFPEIENLNIHARVSRIACRKMIEDQFPEDALPRLTLRGYVDNGEWLEAVRTVTRAEEGLKEWKSL